MTQASKFSLIDLYQEIESLYLKEHFHSILKFGSVFREIDSCGFDSEKIKCLYEIFARTYLELDEFGKAKQVIEQRICFLNGKDLNDTEHAEDLLIFTLLKMELFQKQNLFKEEYKAILAYEKRGKSDNQILNRKFEIEESLYMRYLKVNKYFLYVILFVVLLVNLNVLPNTENYIPVLTAIAVAWYFLNIVMNCRVKRFYLQIVRKIYS